MAEYATRDIIDQEEYYVRHISALTKEDLRGKSEIAAELAHRDIKINNLKGLVRRLVKQIRLHTPDGHMTKRWVEDAYDYAKEGTPAASPVVKKKAEAKPFHGRGI